MRDIHPHLRLRKVCRGSFKIYALVETGCPIAARRLEARATSSLGHAMPAIAYPFSDTAFVLVLAVLDGSQDVTLRLVGETGETLARRTCTIDARLARLSSQIHTFVRDATMERIRNFDLTEREGHFAVSVSRMVREEFETYSMDIIQGEARLETHDDALAHAPAWVRAVDHSGHPISEHEMIMRDSLSVTAEGTCVRTIQFSLRVRWPSADFLLWVHAGSGVADSAPLMDVEECTERRNWWRAWTMPVADDDRYPIYFDTHWATSVAELAQQRATELPAGSRVCVVCAVTGADLRLTDETVESVLAQTHPDLELLLANADGTGQATTDALRRWERRDERVRALSPDTACSPLAALRQAIDAATGDILVFVEDGDILAPDALFRLASELRADETCDIVYADEDVLADGKHTRPFFKPLWEPDLLLGIPYLCHPLCVRTTTARSATIPDLSQAGAEQHLLALCVAAKARTVRRIPRVLYHARPRADAQTDAHVAAVQAYLEGRGILATARPCPFLDGGVSVEFLLTTAPLVSIIIPNKDNAGMLRGCVESLLSRTDYDDFEIIICENNSEDPATFACYDELCSRDPRVRVVRFEGAFNYARVNNFAASFARGDLLVLLNNDTEIIDGGWLRRMAAVCSRPSTAIVGAKLLYADDTVQHAGVIMRPAGVCHRDPFLPRHTRLWEMQLMQDITAVTAACLMVRKSVFDELGGLDDSFAVDYNDVDFCWRVAATGALVVYDPLVELYHFESVSRGKHESKESKERFEREKQLLRDRWPDHFDHIDPACSPNNDQLTAYTKLNAADLPDEDWRLRA